MIALLLAGLLGSAPTFQPTLDNQVPDAFTVETDGMRHTGSGYSCPLTIPDAALVGTRPGAPGDPSAEGAYCEYHERGQPVAYLAISRESGPALTNDMCQALPRSLDLEIGPRLPGLRQYDEVGPWPEGLPAPTVAGEPITPLTCTLSRPPRIIVYSVAAFARNGWTVRATAIPIPPPCCNGHPGVRLVAKDLLGLILLINTTESFKPPSA